ncbi:MAG: sugar phosphate nucleotidyltransferase [Patescibacteria group bacterium]
MNYAVIMAGGQGTRLWPLSRKNMPKQLHRLSSDKSLIQETVGRLLPIFKPDQIFISTTPEYQEEINNQLPEIPAKNYIIEPVAMGNAAACGLATMLIAKKDPEANIIFYPADQSIKNEERFQQTLQYAFLQLNQHPDHIITIGIEPNRPDTGLGYIQMAEEINFDKEKNLRINKVKCFVEKPDQETAVSYISSSQYLWNAGIFIWQTDNFIKLVQDHLPNIYSVLKTITDSYNSDRYDDVLNSEYPNIENITVDYGIMEKTDKILVVPGDFGWSDIGNWSTLFEILSEIEGTNVVSRGEHISIEDENSIVFSGEKLIATIGLKDIVVVDTPDATLICDRNRAHQVKDLLNKLKEEGKENYL